MSIKIHHGYRLAAGTDPWAFTDRLRQVMNPIRDRLDAALLMRRAVAAVDRADRDGEPRSTRPLADALYVLTEEQAKRGHDPHRFELALRPDPATGRLMVLLFADEPAYVRAWEALPEVEPYGYWNNTDRPEGLTEAAWEARREAWERVLPDYAPPVERMLTFSLRPDAPYETGLIRLLSARPDAAAEAERRALLASVARSPRQRARGLAIDLIAATDAGHHAPGLVLRLATILPTDPDHFEGVVDAVARALDPDPVDYVLDPPGDPLPRPLDLTTARELAAAWWHEHGADR